MTFSPFSMSFTRPSLLFLSMRWMTSSSSFLPSRLRMVLPASGPGADKDIDKRGGFWYSTKVPCANDTRWCGAMAAQLICNQWVAGSTPVTSSKKSYDIPLKSGVCRGAFAFMSPTASPPFRKIMPPGGARVLKSAHHDAAVVFGGVALSGAFAPRPGCGSQRLLRCRLHPAGRCPNSSSLFPPLAVVVAVALAELGSIAGAAPPPTRCLSNYSKCASGSPLRGRSEERRVGKECRSRWSPYH